MNIKTCTVNTQLKKSVILSAVSIASVAAFTNMAHAEEQGPKTAVPSEVVVESNNVVNNEVNRLQQESEQVSVIEDTLETDVTKLFDEASKVDVDENIIVEDTNKINNKQNEIKRTIEVINKLVEEKKFVDETVEQYKAELVELGKDVSTKEGELSAIREFPCYQDYVAGKDHLIEMERQLDQVNNELKQKDAEFEAAKIKDEQLMESVRAKAEQLSELVSKKDAKTEEINQLAEAVIGQDVAYPTEIKVDKEWVDIFNILLAEDNKLKSAKTQEERTVIENNKKQIMARLSKLDDQQAKQNFYSFNSIKGESKYKLNEVPYEIREELALYFSKLLTSLHKAGVGNTKLDVKVNKTLMAYADEVATEYEKDHWNWNAGHDINAINKVAQRNSLKFDKNSRTQYYENLMRGIHHDENYQAKATTTKTELYSFVHDSVVGFFFRDAHKEYGHALGLAETKTLGLSFSLMDKMWYDINGNFTELNVGDYNGHIRGLHVFDVKQAGLANPERKIYHGTQAQIDEQRAYDANLYEKRFGLTSKETIKSLNERSFDELPAFEVFRTLDKSKAELVKIEDKYNDIKKEYDALKNVEESRGDVLEKINELQDERRNRLRIVKELEAKIEKTRTEAGKFTTEEYHLKLVLEEAKFEVVHMSRLLDAEIEKSNELGKQIEKNKARKLELEKELVILVKEKEIHVEQIKQLEAIKQKIIEKQKQLGEATDQLLTAKQLHVNKLSDLDRYKSQKLGIDTKLNVLSLMEKGVDTTSKSVDKPQVIEVEIETEEPLVTKIPDDAPVAEDLPSYDINLLKPVKQTVFFDHAVINKKLANINSDKMLVKANDTQMKALNNSNVSCDVNVVNKVSSNTDEKKLGTVVKTLPNTGISTAVSSKLTLLGLIFSILSLCRRKNNN